MVRKRSSLIGLAARTAVVTKTATTVANNSAAKAAAQQQATPTPAAAPAVQPPVVPVADTSVNVCNCESCNCGSAKSSGDNQFMAQLQELADLYSKNLLTAEEFAAAKAKLLG